MRLETSRLLLRDFEAEDWRAVQAYAADPEAVRYRPFGPCTDAETQGVICAAARQAHETPRTLYDFAIVLSATDQLIGGCDIGLRTDRPDTATIGYGLSRAYWGQGYMTEAACALVEFGFEELQAGVVSADVEPVNIASARVLEKIGMFCVGQGRQWLKGEERAVLHYAVSRDEWKARQAMLARSSM